MFLLTDKMSKCKLLHQNEDNEHISDENGPKNEENMSVSSSTTTTLPIRICLVGQRIINDPATVTAAQTFGVPVITCEFGEECVLSTNWLTYFILDDFNFEDKWFQDIKLRKHRILGPPALQQAVERNDGLPRNKRPLYNDKMTGFKIFFTGCRNRDELKRTIRLIEFMNGVIQKRDYDSETTHFISNVAGSSKKYYYAMGIGLPVVQPSWVFGTWDNRDNNTFLANDSDFISLHKVKPFQGRKICFLGFPADENQHMVDVLISNGGIATDIEDPECSHVIISNNTSNNDFAEQLIMSPMKSKQTTPQILSNPLSPANIPMKIDNFTTTPKSSKQQNCDGIVLKHNVANEFLNPNDLSPIYKLKSSDDDENDELVAAVKNNNVINNDHDDGLHNIIEEDSTDLDLNDFNKRRHDSVDNLSMISTDSMAPPFSSAKKQKKLIRTGSITNGLRRSMSFVALKNPITNILRSRRNCADPNASIGSITSIESTFNDSIKKPIKEKMRILRNRIMKGTKRDVYTPRTSTTSTSTATSANDNETSYTITTPNRIASTTAASRYLPGTSTDIKQDYEHIKMQTDNLSCDQTTETSLKLIESETTAATLKSIDNKQTAIVNSENLDEPHTIQMPPKHLNSHTFIVKSDWFWYTIQKGHALETDYLFKNYLDSMDKSISVDRRESLPGSFIHRKRKRQNRTATDTTTRRLSANKRRSSISDAGLLSISGSFLDYTASPIVKHDSKENDLSFEHAPKKKSMRYNHFMDLFGTESNYVGILHTIVTLFQKPLEEMADTPEYLLNKSEVRSIFNNFSPIHDVHLKMLNRFHELQANWKENCLIGKIFLDYQDALVKAYPPYVNFFEQMKETLIQCDAKNQRFHAFLKINQTKAECGRQSLQDLMIRPVQRLPSISLLIGDILKHTPKNNPDYVELERALKAIKEVMTHINEDKRKTEGRLALFDIFNDIDNCPPDLVSSHRSFISKCECTELSNNLSGRDDRIMLFLFTDYMELCKIKKSHFNSVKSPTIGQYHNHHHNNGVGGGVGGSQNVTKQKLYKHLKLLPLSSISIVYNITDGPRAFALPYKDKFFAFSICDEIDKTIYLKSLCKQLAENACCADAEQFLCSYDSQELGVDINEINLGTLKKAFNYARTRLNVKRAFSFNKTPMRLKRNVTTSPLFGSTNSLTPATQMAQMKLPSCSNINEVDDDDDNDDDDNENDNDNNTNFNKKVKHPQILVAPLSVQPTRKNKNATLSSAEF